MADTQFEKDIIKSLKWILNNNQFKSKDLLEWSSSKETVKKNLQDGEIAVFVDSLGVWCAVSKDSDKRK